MKLAVDFKTYRGFIPLSEEEQESEELDRLLKRYVNYGEFVTVEFDTKTQTATVLTKE